VHFGTQSVVGFNKVIKKLMQAMLKNTAHFAEA
jgi:hypothetical protein